MKSLLPWLPALLCLAAHADPAKHAAAPTENPAVDTMQQPPPAEAGTTIVGEQDSDVGLYLTPWKEEHADNIDPPPGLLDEAPAPVDARSFARQVRDAATIYAYRRARLQPNR